MNNRQLKRHDPLPNLTTQTALGSPDSRPDGLGLPPDPTAIADPRIFVLATKQTLDSSFTGLQSTLTPYSRSPAATPSSWSQRGQQPDPRPPQRGKQKVCIPTVARHLLPLPPASQWLCQTPEVALWVLTKPGTFVSDLYGYLSSGGLGLRLST